MVTDYVDQVANSIIAQLREGTAPWVKPWAPGERFMPYNPTTGNEYRGMNAMWLLSRAESRDYGDARWMTYRQAQEQGAQVRKGEKGTPIQFWKWQGLEPVRDDAGRPMLDQEGNPLRQMVRYERPRVMAAVVFNAQQIDGLVPAPARPAMAEWERHERAEHILSRSGVDVRHVPGDRAFYRLSDDRITLPELGQFPSADRYYATALHELGHATGHPSRLARDMAYPFGSEGYAREELRAEIASLMLGEQLGIGHDPGQHVAYIESWIKALEKDPREVFRAATDAEKITKLVRSFELEQEQQAEGVRTPGIGNSTQASQRGGTERAPPITEPQQEAETAAAVEVRAPVLIQENHPAMATSDERTYLAVPYAEKDAAKQLGAKWDRTAKAWYVPAGVDLDAFGAWMPAKGSVHIAVEVDPREQFATALRESGLRPDGPIEMDGQMHRVPVEGDQGKERSGAYKGYLDGRPAGYIQNYRTGLKVNWAATSNKAVALSAQDRAQMAAEAAQKRHDRALEREHQYERVAQQADALWAAAAPAQAHPYLDDKGVPSHGLREGTPGQSVTVRDQDGKQREVSIAGQLLVPVADAGGKLSSLQFIRQDGAKMFMPEGRVEGGHFVIGDARQPGPLVIAEGYATGATVHELLDAPVAVAFNAGNLATVARTYRALYPERPIYIAGDNDHRREAEGKPNVGRERAEQAAAAISGFALLPAFAEQGAGSDWNDLARSTGPGNARQQLLAGVAIAEREQMARGFAAARDQAGHKQDRGPASTPTPVLGRDRTPEMELER